MDKGLNLRQGRFVAAYLMEPNATKAAIAAGYSPKRAEVTGCELVRNRKVADALERHRAKAEDAVQITVEEIITTLRGIATDQTQPASARVSALREINQMLGHHAPKQINVREQGVTLVFHLDGSQPNDLPVEADSAIAPRPIAPNESAQ
jgi:phage terminase small subunit